MELLKNYNELINKLNVAQEYELRDVVVQIGELPIPEGDANSSLEHIVYSIIGQQLSSKAADCIKKRFSKLLKDQNDEIEDFLIEENIPLIRTCGVSGNKSKALICCNMFFKEHILSDAILRDLSHTERSKLLCGIWGVGQWTCDMLSIFYFNDQQIWPAGDIGVRRGLEKALGKKIEDKTFVEIGKRITPFQSHLCIYMWHIVDEKIEISQVE